MHLFSSHSSHRSHAPPNLIFQSPDAEGNIRATTAQNVEVALFTLHNNTLIRLRPTQQQICTISRSSWSGTTSLVLHPHSQKIKLREVGSALPINPVQELDTPFGKFQWRSKDSGYEELRDDRDVLLARGKLHGTIHIRPDILEVFISGPQSLLDLILAAWVAKFGAQKLTKEDCEAVETVADVVGALAGN